MILLDLLNKFEFHQDDHKIFSLIKNIHPAIL